ncbi:hypothetical protein OIU79_010670 [Salix purpurea]|uniref:At1g68980-like TPR repeats domain-containing protein n=1 Tax=Salix purpurea TaxID=77065 RepID=A0A9Q0QG60_SALPP|nr:hypothetical protein OIU79_010670 [Salix purpurea]
MALFFSRKNPLSYSLGVFVPSAIHKTALIEDHSGEFFPKRVFERFRALSVFYGKYQLVAPQHFSTNSVSQPGRICWRGDSNVVLLRKLEIALREHQVDEAWVTFIDFKKLYGFPTGSMVNRLISRFSYSSDHHWLQKACDLVFLILKEKPGLLQFPVLTKLSISLARAQMPVPTSMILRVMLERENMPPLTILWSVVSHMVKTEIGACLASNFLVQMCDCYLRLSAKGSVRAKVVKPDAMIFNLALDACVKFKLSLKGQEIVELMSKFYDSLLKLHFKFDDIDSATQLLLDMHKSQESVRNKKLRMDQEKRLLVPIGSNNLKTGLKIQDFNVLGQSRFCSDVISACIHLGWLEMAHDILDDMDAAGAPVGSTLHMALLTAYYSREMFKEAKALLRQMRKAGFVEDLSDEMVATSCLSGAANNASSLSNKSDLIDFLVREMREEEKAIPSMVYELNSSIYYFCKAKMMEDAFKTYQRMKHMNIQPTVQTFSYLIDGFSSLGMYRDITILWGDIKRNMGAMDLEVSRDLYEVLHMNFLRGGYFERAMEVIGYMKERNMYCDKWMYKDEFLKLHKNLYWSLKASETRTEAQSKRLEYVKAFRKWVGID